jgi:hypothetical protein
MNIEKIDESNALLYAAKYYDNPQCFDTVEFYEDLNRFKYVKRLLNKYEETGELKERLVLNHITVLNNVFGTVGSTKLLLLKCKDQLSLIMPFLVFLNMMPESVSGIGIENLTIRLADVEMDQNITNALGRNVYGQQDN